MRKFKNHEAVKVNNAEEAMEFLKYLEDNTDLKWNTGEKPTGVNKSILTNRGYPIFIETNFGRLFWARAESSLESETKIIPLSEFIKPKVTYTREQAEKVFEECSLFHNDPWSLSKQDVVEFLNHKFPKTTLEQVTEVVKDLGEFTIEQTSAGEIIISPINNK